MPPFYPTELSCLYLSMIPGVERRKKEAEARLLFFNHMPDPIIDEFGDKLYKNQKHNEEQARPHVPGLLSVNRESIRVLSTGTTSSSDYLEITQTYRHSAADEISKPDFGKNPLTNDKEKLAELYDLWLSVVSNIADYVYLNVRITGSRIVLKEAETNNNS